MKTLLRDTLGRLSTAALALCLPTGCANSPTAGVPQERILYQDRNHDGRIDEEKHVITNGCDMDWSLVDTDFDGIYDRMIRYGYAVTSSPVRIPIRPGTIVQSPPSVPPGLSGTPAQSRSPRPTNP